MRKSKKSKTARKSKGTRKNDDNEDGEEINGGWVTKITTKADGSTLKEIRDSSGGLNYFNFPPNTQAHCDELKRAQSSGLDVDIKYHYNDNNEEIIDVVSVLS